MLSSGLANPKASLSSPARTKTRWTSSPGARPSAPSNSSAPPSSPPFLPCPALWPTPVSTATRTPGPWWPRLCPLHHYLLFRPPLTGASTEAQTQTQTTAQTAAQTARAPTQTQGQTAQHKSCSPASPQVSVTKPATEKTFQLVGWFGLKQQKKRNEKDENTQKKILALR